MKIETSSRQALLRTLGFVIASAVAAVSAGAVAPKASPPGGPNIHRIVVQVTIDGEENWNKILNQVENLKKGFAPDSVQIEVVTHGDAAGLVVAKNAAVSQRIQKIEATGTQFALCENTRRKGEIKPEELTPGVTIVPSGIVQVIRRQEEGWSYIKAGP